MYYLNKLIWFFCNPTMLIFLIGLVGAVFFFFARHAFRRWGVALLVFDLFLFGFTNTPLCVALLGLPLERPYLPSQFVKWLPSADAIVVLGGGMCKVAQMEYPDMNEAADRVWHAARLFKAEKAPLIVVSGANDRAATVPLLLDFGVPREAILVDDESRNTYENSRFTEKLLGEGKKVLLVTSAWHMSRALGNFSRTSLEVVPAATDFVAQGLLDRTPFGLWFLPTAGNADLVNALAKEWLGRLAAK